MFFFKFKYQLNQNEQATNHPQATSYPITTSLVCRQTKNKKTHTEREGIGRFSVPKQTDIFYKNSNLSWVYA